MPTVNSSMQGKICMVTGANSGIGKATALALAQMGATVVMVCRDRARGEQARSEITTKSKNNAVALLQADLSSQQSIRQLVEDFQHHYTHLHVLINNAGASFPRRRATVDGLEMTFAVPEVEGVTGKYFVKSIPTRSASISYDESLQRHLWEQSAKLVNW